MDVKVFLDDGAVMPTKAYKTDAGFDLYTPVSVILPEAYIKDGNPHAGVVSIDTGVHMSIPEGYCGLLVSKSGLNVKYNIQSTGLIDSGYTGSIVAKLYNMSDRPYLFNAGDKISQIVLLPIPDVNLVEVDVLEDTDRSNNGFGSSGR